MGIDAPEHVFFDPDDLQNFQHWGCYYANTRGGRIFIGKGTWIAPNVGIITTNHKLTDLEEHDPPKDVRIGRNCWIGISAVVLPGVALGDHTVVAAGAVVTKSFPDGWCVIGGNPASVLKPIEQEPVIR